MSSVPETPRLLLINGNTSTSITGYMHDLARDFYGQRAQLEARTAPWGAAYIKTRRDCAVAAHAVLETFETAVEDSTTPFDAAILACFGEPGIGAVRELGVCPVVGMAEAAVLSALQLGQRYVIVTPGRHWPGMLEELLRGYGLFERCGGIIPVITDGLERASMVALVREAVDEAVDCLGADVVIVGGAAFAGIPRELATAVSVPVVDSLYAALGQALGLAMLGVAISPSSPTPPASPAREAAP